MLSNIENLYIIIILLYIISITLTKIKSCFKTILLFFCAELKSQSMERGNFMEHYIIICNQNSIKNIYYKINIYMPPSEGFSDKSINLCCWFFSQCQFILDLQFL